jgi:VCBS repeat-containing protein
LNYVGQFDATFSSHGADASPPAHGPVDSFFAHAPSDALVVPDAHLLFNADFKRSGADLILSKDDREFVLHDYFKGEKHRALASPDGAHLTADVVEALTGEVQVSQADGSIGAHQVIGHVTKLAGNATVVRNGVSIILNMGDNVEKGDVVQSGSNSTLGITFVDGTVFGLSSNARMVLNEMVYDPNGSNNSTLISLVAGTVSFVAGQTAKHGDMKIDTPVATMGIRGTAVLVQIDFSVPGQNGQPNASFQVLVEPDGTTGSYILFDKTTLQPIAVVNQAGQQININNGVVSQTNSQLSPDIQKLIQDVFTQKFSDNTNTKSTSPFNDSIIPQSTPLIVKLADNATATPTYTTASLSSGSSFGPNGTANSISHIAGPPKAVVLDATGHVTTSFFQGEIAGKTGDATDHDVVTGTVSFVDINAGDRPSVSVSFSSAAYQNAQHQNMTLSAQQQIAVAATEINIQVTPAAGNNNNGSAIWTYSLPDNAFDFLAAGETLTLTYQLRVDNNFSLSDEFTIIPVTITITGTNDVPVITTSAQTIAFSGGTSVSGGILTTHVPTNGSLAFTDPDLTDTHTVSAKLTGAVGVLNGVEVLNGVDKLPPGPYDLLKAALTASIGTDSTGTGVGTIDWNLANLPVYIADFIPKGETLKLTYTVTLTDSQGAATTQDVTVTIVGTDTPAVVWIDTTASPSGGLWNKATNWETGTIPTATDDVIIITNQLIGLAPVYPVTIKTTADSPTAAAGSLTMNDFGPLFTNSPTLINQSTLTVGLGGISLKADSIIENDKSASIDVAGSVEVLDHSSLLNYGQITLQGGGDFKDQGTITNFASGTIEISGGPLDALNVLVDVVNSGLIVVDAGAVLAVNGGTLDGGTVSISGILELQGAGVLKDGSLDNSGHIDVSGSGNALDGEHVTANELIEILPGGALTIDLGSVVSNTGTIRVDAGSTGVGELTVNDATIDGGSVLNSGAIKLTGAGVLENGVLQDFNFVLVSGLGNALHHETVSGGGSLQILPGGALTIDQGSTVFDPFSLEVGGGTLTLNDATIDTGIVFNDPGGTIDLSGGAVLESTWLYNFSQINVSGTGNALDGEIVSNGEAGAIEIMGVLTLDLGTVITGGTLTNTGSVFVESSTGSTLDGVAVDNSFGAIEVDTVIGDGPPTTTLTLDGGTTIANGTLTIGIVGILDVSTNLGAALVGVSVGNSGLIQVDAGSVLTLDDTTISGGVVTDNGTIHVTGDSAIDRALVSACQITVDFGKILTLDGTTVTGGTVSDNGAIGVDVGAILELNGVALSGGAISNGWVVEIAGSGSIDNDALTNTNALLVVNPNQTLTLDGTTITGGTVADFGTIRVDSGETLKLSGVALDAGAVSNAGTVEIIGSGGINADAFANTDATLLVDAGQTLTLDGTTITGGAVTDHGTIAVDADQILELNGVALSGGAIGNAGTIEITGSGSIDNDAFANTDATLLIDAGQTLTLDGTTITGGTVADNGTVNVDAGDILTLIGTTIAGGELTVAGILESSGISAIFDAAITNTGTIEATGGTLTIDPDQPFTLTNSSTLEADGGELDITGEMVTNAGVLQAIDDSTLKLTSTQVTNSGTISDTSGSTIDLAGSSISGGMVKIAGIFDSTGISAIDGAVITNSGTFEVTGGTLTIDSASSVSNSAGGTLEANGGRLIIDGSLSGNVEIAGASFLELGDGASGAYSSATVGFAAGSTGTLKLDHAKSFTGTIAGLDDNTLDLGDIAYGSNPTVSYANGILSVLVDGKDVADIRLAGDYSGSNWSVTSDGNGGTDVTEIPGAISGLDSHGNAIQGAAVTASVTDGGQATSGVVYDWQVSKDGGKTWVDASGTNGLSSYTPVEADEGKLLRVALSFTDNSGHPETSSVSAGVVQESLTGDLVATLDSTAAKQGVTIHVTGVTDGGIAVSSGVSYAWQISSDGGQHWSTVGSNSSFTPGESDEGKSLQLVVTYAEASGSESSTYSLGMPNDLVATLDSTTALQGLAIHVTGVEDGGTPESAGLGYAWQVSSDNGQHWTTVGSNSSYTPTASVAGDLLQVVVSYADSGENESTTDSLGVIVSAKEWLGGDHDWQTAAPWAPSGAPASGDNVLVDVSGTYTLKIDQAAVAHSLVVNDSGATVEIVEGNTLTLGGNLTIEAGRLQVDAGGTLKEIAGSATLVGAFTDNGTIESAGGTLEIANNVSSGGGQFKIDAGDTLQFDHADALNVAFAGSGELILKDPAHFTGTISDSGGSLTAADVVDLAGFDTGALVHYSGTKSGGTVTVSEAGHATAVLHVGANSTNWGKPVTDGHGGILIHDPPDDAGGQAVDSDPGPAASQTIVASVPNQTLTGLAASDNFVFNFASIGQDTVTDFHPATDTLQFTSAIFANAQAALNATHDDGHGNTVVALDGHDTVTLGGVLKAQLHATDFHIV